MVFRTLPSGRIGVDADSTAQSEANHFGNCPVCGGCLDMCDLDQVPAELVLNIPAQSGERSARAGNYGIVPICPRHTFRRRPQRTPLAGPSLVDDPMNANSATKPRMMPIKNLTKNDPVGVLKPCCTMPPASFDDPVSRPC